MTSPNKVFGIGLSRTGTKSLRDALFRLGFRTRHFPHFSFAGDNIMLDKDMLEYDALVDTPVALAFPDLDEQFPGSKFIYTVRDMDSWLDSCRRFFYPGRFEKAPIVDRLSLHIYGTDVFERDLFIHAYERHEERVFSHFEGREEDLLVLDICGGEGWQKLAPFLGKGSPSEPFPRRPG